VRASLVAGIAAATAADAPANANAFIQFFPIMATPFAQPRLGGAQDRRMPHNTARPLSLIGRWRSEALKMLESSRKPNGAAIDPTAARWALAQVRFHLPAAIISSTVAA
jgi:hypothetical protein